MKIYNHDGPTGNNMRLRRLMALVADVIICIAFGYFCYVMMWTCAGVDYTEVVDQIGMKGVLYDSMPFYMTPFFLKDVFGRSLGKIIFGLCIVEKDTGEKASFGKRFFRNFSLMILPIEGIALLMSETNTRIADKLFEIQVVKKK